MSNILPWRQVLPSWTDNLTHDSMPDRLVQEILQLCELIEPTQSEEQKRKEVALRLSSVVGAIWPHAEVKLFGSFATGLYLPTSDIDAVVLGCGDSQNTPLRLRTLANALQRAQVAIKTEIVDQALVPIVKFTDKISGISVDVSFARQTGIESVEFIKGAMRDFPTLKPIYQVLKMFLHQKGLNEVYKTGGLSSFTLFVMVLTHLQTNGGRRTGSMNSREKTWDEERNLGLVLRDFFDFYGGRLNVKEDGVSCRSGGSIFKKGSREFLAAGRPYLLVEHPQTPEINIAKNSFNFEHIRSEFREAHRFLEKGLHDASSPLLARLIHMNGNLARQK